MAKEGWTYDDLRTAVGRKEIAPVYLFYGEEDLLADEATELIVDAALPQEQRGFNLDVVYGSDADVRDIISHATSFPLMSDRRVVVVRELDKLPHRELLASYLESPSETTTVILHSSNPDFRRKPYLTAKRNGTAVEFKPLRENQIPAWIAAKAQAAGRTIGPDAARLLSTYAGTSLREIQGEIDKLCLFTLGRQEITVADVSSVVGSSREFNIFELQRAIGGRVMDRAMLIMQRMLEAGESPTMIIVMLTRFFIILWNLHDLTRRGATRSVQMETTGLSQFQIREFTEAMSLFGPEHVKKAFDVLIRADEQLKTSMSDPTVVMQLLIVQLLTQDAPSRSRGAGE